MNRRIVAVALGAIVSIPFSAFADPTPEPVEPDDHPMPPNPMPEETPVVDPPPTVIVNPPPPPRAVVVSTEPEYETVEDRWNAPMFTSGALMFAVGYGGSVIAAASVDRTDREQWAERLYVPVVGPWLALNDHGSCPITAPACDTATTTKVLLVADGVFQAAGVLTMMTGLMQPTHHRRVVRLANDKTIHVRPTVVGRGSGIMMSGRF